MEADHTNSDSHHDDAIQGGDNETGNWHRRLRVRKPSASSLTVKSTNKEEKEPLKKTFKNEHQNDQAVNSSVSKLMFTCPNCQDNSVFSPSDLLTHFNVVHGGKGDPPPFPCDMCSFATPDFTSLQQHRMKHKQCRLTCEICNDNVLQTLAQLRKHCKAQHSLNGQYHCEKCKFASKELKIFVHHSCPPLTESPVDSIETSGVQPLNGDVTNNDGELQKEELLNTDDHQGWKRKNWWRNREVSPKQQSNKMPDLKLLLPKPEVEWTSSGFLPFSAAGLLDERGVLLNPAKTLEETEKFLERTVKSGKKWPVTLNSDLASLSCTGSLSLQPSTKQYSIPLPADIKSGQDKFSGLMERNNISVPPDCTTKVLGFKIVDGKKHLILKIIPSAKTETSADTTGLSTVETNGQMETPSDQRCSEWDNKVASFPFCDATSTSGQREETAQDAPQIDSTEHDSKGVSGTEEQLNADQRKAEGQVMSSDVLSDSNNMQHLNGVAADASVDVNTLYLVGTNSQEKAVQDLKENCSASQNDSECPGHLTSIVGSLEEGLKFPLSSLMSEEDRNSNIDLKSTAMPSSAASYCPLNQEKQAIFEPNTLNPSFLSLHKHATESLFNPPSENEDLLFKDSGDDYTNNVDPRDASVPVDQSCDTETVEELVDSCHNAELYQTLEELPVTTVSHLLDDPVTFRGTTSQSSQLGSLSAEQVSLQTPNAIQVISPVTIEKDTPQSNVCLSPVNEPAMKRKRQGQTTSFDSQDSMSKSRRQTVHENDLSAPTAHWKPVPEMVERTLRLLPVCSSQLIKVPRLNQPVIVLNHPDTDIPEVSNIMRVVHKHKGAVQKVVLSQGTLKALSSPADKNCRPSPDPRVWPRETVKERFILKLKLKRLFGQKYKVTPSSSKAYGYQSNFRCWFCGRLFKNQETWVGHGQRHLMEATRDWNKLFSSAGQCNSPIQSCFH